MATRVLGLVYGLWFYIMFSAFAVAASMPLESRLRMTFLLSFLLAWSVAGTLVAIRFSSVGPAFVEHLSGDPTFAPLMRRLAEQDKVLEVFSLTVQHELWAGYARTGHAAMGISAFPSMHLCIAALLTFFGFRFGRVPGWLLAAFAGTVMIGSVHLGWHYAADGVAGIALAGAFWWLSRRFTDWWFERRRQRVALPPAGLA